MLCVNILFMYFGPRLSLKSGATWPSILQRIPSAAGQAEAGNKAGAPSGSASVPTPLGPASAERAHYPVHKVWEATK